MNAARPSRERFGSWWLRPILALAVLGLTLLTLEVGARLYVAVRWDRDHVASLTRLDPARGRFLVEAPFGYRLRPDFEILDRKRRAFRHNALGFRGREIPAEKPRDTVRIVLMGGSTVYGIAVGDSEVASALLEKRLRGERPGRGFEVINAGVPGWSSRETLLNLDHRVLPLAPDLVVMLDGRNELYPQLFAGFRPDYDHYRVMDARVILETNAGYRRLFRASHLLMWLGAKVPGVLGLEPGWENPVYATVRFENRPTLESARRHARQHSRYAVFRRNVVRFVENSRAGGAEPILATMVFDAERFRAGVLAAGSFDVETLEAVVARNNRIVMEVARRREVPLAEVHSLNDPGLLVDDCHFNAAGEQRLAELLSATILSLLD